MEQETHDKKEVKFLLNEYATPISIVMAGIIIASALPGSRWGGISNIFAQSPGGDVAGRLQVPPQQAGRSALEEQVLPAKGVKLPVVWGDMGARLVEAGAIDPVSFKQVYQSRGTFPAEYEKLLSGKSDGRLTITEDNAGYLLNLLWALGLANTNPILGDKTEMMNPGYGGAGNFASTGGWTVAKGNAMEHYSMHAFVTLTPAQQELVGRVSQGIFRPCCGNSTHFPDCNHGMAMLGLLELMASQGVSEEDMYKAALAVNSYWFPGTYLTMAEYMQNKGVDWKKVSPQEMLGADYSSAAGFRNIASQVSAPSTGSGPSTGTATTGGSNGCGVEAGAQTAPRQQSGCGI